MFVYCSGVGSENIFFGFIVAPIIPIPNGTITTNFVSCFDFLPILRIFILRRCRVSHEESIMRISSWMLLRLKECIEIPEGAFNELVSSHLFKAHLKQYFTELFAHFHQWMEIACCTVQISPEKEMNKNQNIVFFNIFYISLPSAFQLYFLNYLDSYSSVLTDPSAFLISSS